MANAVLGNPTTTNIRRSKLKGLSHSVDFTSKHGLVIPFEWMEVLPGDTWTVVMNKFIHMGAPVRQLLGNINVNFDAFYVPFSQIFPDFKKFWGENPNGRGFSNLDNSIQIPWTKKYPSRDMDFEGNAQIDTTNTLGDYMGIVADKGTDHSKFPSVSKMPLLAYYKIINRWYINRVLQEPYTLNYDSGFNAIGAQRLVDGTVQDFTYGSAPHRCNKVQDLFTNAVEDPQAGESVFLPLGTKIPVVNGTSEDKNTSIKAWPEIYDPDNIGRGQQYVIGGTRTPGNASVAADQAFPSEYATSNAANISGLFIKNGLYADLTNAAAIEWNQLRILGAEQRYKEKAMDYGSQYYSWLLAHFGVKAPNLLLGEPECLSHNGVSINMSPIYQTTGATDDQNSALGKPGCVSDTRQDDYCFTKTFIEPGIVMFMMTSRHKRTYSQGIRREATRLNPLQFYLPEFALRGKEMIKGQELFVAGDPEIDNQAFGFQEADYSYRNAPNRVSGKVNPSNKGSDGLWTLADKLTATPVIGNNFLLEDEDELNRVLTTTGLEDPYLISVYLDITAIRPMPTKVIPSLTGWY